MLIKLTLWTWVSWGILLILQNATFTWITRARAGRSLLQHGLSTVIAQLIAFLTGLIALDNSIRILQGKNRIKKFSNAGSKAFHISFLIRAREGVREHQRRLVASQRVSRTTTYSPNANVVVKKPTG